MPKKTDPAKIRGFRTVVTHSHLRELQEKQRRLQSSLDDPSVQRTAPKTKAQIEREIETGLTPGARRNAYHENHLCASCGQKFGSHATAGNPYVAEGACPGPGKFPTWPTTIRDEAKAGRLFDDRVEKFWRAGRGIFRPKM